MVTFHHRLHSTCTHPQLTYTTAISQIDKTSLEMRCRTLGHAIVGAWKKPAPAHTTCPHPPPTRLQAGKPPITTTPRNLLTHHFPPYTTLSSPHTPSYGLPEGFKGFLGGLKVCRKRLWQKTTPPHNLLPHPSQPFPALTLPIVFLDP